MHGHHGLSRLFLGISGRLLIITILVCFLILFGKIIMNPPSCHISGPKEWISTDGLRTFSIRTTWNGGCVNHEAVKLSLGPAGDEGLRIRVLSPFFNSPAAPDGEPGKAFNKLWEYEVVEAFFLNENNEYLEVELSPHGQHLLLMLNGRRKMVKDMLPLDFYKAIIKEDRWNGEVVIPKEYFPPSVTKFNAYAIHGEGTKRTYESLYPALDTPKPDFHRLEFFQPLNMSELINNYVPDKVSDLWKPYVKQE